LIILPYSTYLVPSDFHVFLHLKTSLGGRQFHDNEVKEAVFMWFASEVASFYNAGIQKLVPRYECQTLVETMLKSRVRYVQQMAIYT
jgi:hypothetical protein